MVTDNHYRWDFIQLSTDTKPTPATSPKVVDGSTLYTSDDSKLYIWYKDQWYEKTTTGGGGGTTYTAGDGIIINEDTISVDSTELPIKNLTVDDYNYPTANPDGIALWLLPAGLYKIQQTDALKVYYSSSSSSTWKNWTFLLLKNPSSDTISYVYDYDTNYNQPHFIYSRDIIDYRNGIITDRQIVDNLTTTSYTKPLSANQGQVLNNKITPTTDASAPTTSTIGELGKIYIDTTNADAYMCVDTTGGTYTWKKITP